MARGEGNQEEAGLRPTQVRKTRFDDLTKRAVTIFGDLSEAQEKADRLGRPMRVKLGLDPTAPDIHLGHTVVLQMLRDFQDRGATAVLIIGDHTTLVGDPTGRNSLRPQLTPEQIKENADTYLSQATKILDPNRLEVRRNSEWLGKMTSMDMFNLLRESTIAQIMEREDFANRFEKNEPISMLELVYPLLQGYDSKAVDADVELGGTDQLYNVKVGRGMNNQVGMMLPILRGIDGVEKMSKSKKNYIGVSQEPAEMFGRTMRVPDEVMPEYWRLVSGHPDAEKIATDLETGKLHPGHAKRLLAKTLITRFHSAEAAAQAEENFNAKHVRHEAPADTPTQNIQNLERNPSGNVYLPDMMQKIMGVESKSQARRLLKDGSVKLDGEVIQDLEIDPTLLAGKTLRVGKRRYLHLV